ncbi:pyrokinin-1 receptor-like isoform X2 [Portunus trituberculatus]|uniref:pyrokinin-1 receptor-like isoform X2 n=1 Tax=Portunus trituberculatus TaxID=210409 RepID=UPI001E1CD842|nr:pyrokinin-1 receptor-like isoform X2 [Portunus trituberculatus]
MGEAEMGALVNSTPSSILALTPTESHLSTFLMPTATHDHGINGSLLSAGGNDSLVEEVEGEGDQLVHGMTMTVMMTVIYFLITVTGVLGNVATCIVIVRNRIMHTATNYYLFSLAISDLLLLAFGMPDEIYMLWRGRPYIFGAYFCFVRGFTAEISTNASILTIAAFTVERYIGICHPLRSQTMSQLGRVVRSIAVIWGVAIACAVPIAIQYGIVYENHLPSGEEDPNSSACLIKNPIYLAFEISTVLFFVAPLLLITVLYLCIAVQLKRSTRLARAVPSITSPNSSCTNDGSRNKAVIKMLVAVVIAFFLCFAPHQTQRLVALHGDASNLAVVKLFNILHNISGISYYISTCVNPILYHIMSNRFRKALKVTLGSCLEGEKACVGGGGFQDSDATFDHLKNGLSSHHFPLHVSRHHRALSMHQRPFLATGGRLRGETGGMRASSFHHGSQQRPTFLSQCRGRPSLPRSQHPLCPSPLQEEHSLPTNGTSHTWV